MEHYATLTLTQTELTSIQILIGEFTRRELAGMNLGDLYQTNHTRLIWLKACQSTLLKVNKGIAQCEYENASDRAYYNR